MISSLSAHSAHSAHTEPATALRATTPTRRPAPSRLRAVTRSAVLEQALTSAGITLRSPLTPSLRLRPIPLRLVLILSGCFTNRPNLHTAIALPPAPEVSNISLDLESQSLAGTHTLLMRIESIRPQM